MHVYVLHDYWIEWALLLLTSGLVIDLTKFWSTIEFIMETEPIFIDIFEQIEQVDSITLLVERD